jgi:hypothetical protein
MARIRRSKNNPKFFSVIPGRKLKKQNGKEK